jgi:K+-transporting ATPase ATPase A chain
MVQMLAILLIPAALTYTFGRMVKDTRQGWAVLAAMTVIFVPLMLGVVALEQAGTPLLAEAGAGIEEATLQPGGNMEGKEARYGITTSAIWAAATTAASNGSVNSMHDSYMPLGGLVTLFNMHLGEVVFGGTGSGLYGMLVFAIVAVFVAGLMIGRTPEYLGKKIGPLEMKLAIIAFLIPSAAILLFTALGTTTDLGKAGPLNAGPHGYSEILYAFTSAGANNGSAFAGLTANTPFYNTTQGIEMLVARFLPMAAVLALAGALAKKQLVPVNAGTLPTNGPLFVGLLSGIVFIVGGLTFFPALALGPIVEHFLVNAGQTF